MKLFFLDDSTQRTCSRPRVGKLVAVGGMVIEADAVRGLEGAIDILCQQYRFPQREPFKWSPGRDHWMRTNLIEDRRDTFFKDVLELARQHGAIGHVIIADTSKALATKRAQTHEMDVLVMALERFDWALPANELGIVIAARPSGGRGDEDHFLDGCVEIITAGTDYVAFRRLATNVLTMPFPNSRMLQVADLIVSITTAMIAGHTTYAGRVFPAVKALLRTEGGRIGGVGVKIHPDYTYANLYHWVLGDSAFWRFQSGWTLPMESRPYFNSADVY